MSDKRGLGYQSGEPGAAVNRPSAPANPSAATVLSAELLPVDAPNRWVEPTCGYCKLGAPCLTHDRRPRTLAQNRVIFGPSFGFEPTEADRKEAAFPWDR